MNSVFVNTQGLYQRRRAYNMSYRNDFLTSLGVITPCYWQELMPNSSWRCNAHGLVRFLPMLAPIMDNIDLYMHFWQAPERILYGEEFTDMITGESEEWPGIYFTPQNVRNVINSLVLSKYSSESSEKKGARVRKLVSDGSIFDLLGYDKTLFGYIDDITPATTATTGKLNARKFCMYFRLIRDWYTNENVEPFTDFFDLTESFDKLNFLDTASSGDISALIGRLVFEFHAKYGTAGFATHAWPADYFTKALPSLQYGDPTYLPLADSAPVVLNNGATTSIHIGKVNASTGIVIGAEEELPSGDNVLYAQGTGESANAQMLVGNGAQVHDIYGTLRTPLEGEADLSEATAITINELRVANALQVFKEREMRYGRKAPEYYKGFYGVTPGDLRLQLPKFLGGGKLAVNISDVEQTSQSAENNPLGKLAGKGTALAGGFAGASTFVAEETLVFGICWLMPKVTYSTALSRHDTKLNDRFQYFNPSFAHIGEQEVFMYEIYPYNYGKDAGNVEFGYQPRYTEYRFHMNECHGEFKSSLSYWTLSRLFGSQPALNADFIYMQPIALNRIFSVQTDSNGLLVNNVLCSLYYSAAVIQPLSRYGTPGMLA